MLIGSGKDWMYGHRGGVDGNDGDEHLSFRDEFCVPAVCLVGVVNDPLDHI